MCHDGGCTNRSDLLILTGLLDCIKSLQACLSDRAVVPSTGIRVDDAQEAFEVSTANGAEGVLRPTQLRDEASGTSALVSEIRAYGDCVLRFISGDFQVLLSAICGVA